VTYLAPAPAEAGPVMYAAPQVVYAAGAEVGQASSATAPTVLEDGREMAIDASGAAVTEGGQIANLVPTGVEGSPVPTYVAPCVPAEPVAYMEAGAGQQMFAAPMAARVNVSHEIFAKLAAGMQLTPEEMRSLSGLPAADGHPTATPPEQEQPVGLEESAATAATVECDTAAVTGVAAADEAAAITSAEGKKNDPKTKSDSKKALKASKKKKEKGCC